MKPDPRFIPCSKLPPVPVGSLWRVSGVGGGVVIRRAPHDQPNFPPPPGEETYRVYDTKEVFLVLGAEEDWRDPTTHHVKVMSHWGPMYIHRFDFGPQPGRPIARLDGGPQ